jgi:hypothetical protein
VVFTLPHELIPVARQNPRVVYGILFRAVSQTLLTIAADPKHLGARLGFLAVLHTWNQKLLAHPHLHCLVPAGRLAFDQTRWIGCRHAHFFLSVPVLAAKFRGQFLALLRRAAAEASCGSRVRSRPCRSGKPLIASPGVAATLLQILSVGSSTACTFSC